MENKHRPYGAYEKYIKRPMDCFLATLAIIMISPALLIIAILVRIKLGSPILFTQNRPGKDEKIFKLYKFRTMTDEKDKDGNQLPDNKRLTEFGRKLRSTSLDELPELFNIAKGDMSIVGPRPLLVRYLERYNLHQARRHEVRPGFTGLAQVHGRNSISWDEKFDWDIKYIDHITFWGDWKIIFKTVKMVLKREGISSDSSVTMEEFIGTPVKIIDEVQRRTDTSEKLIKSVIIIGASGHGKVVADIVQKSDDRVLGFLDDNPNLPDTFIGFPVLGTVDDYKKYNAEFVVAIGNASVRERITEKMREVSWYTALHPTAAISDIDVAIGAGTVVMANTVINSSVKIGKHCIINSGAVVEHDNFIGDYVHVSVGAKLAGTVRIEKGTWIGIGACVSNNVCIYRSCMIGAGAVVIKDIEEIGTYVGVPAERIDMKDYEALKIDDIPGGGGIPSRYYRNVGLFMEYEEGYVA